MESRILQYIKTYILNNFPKIKNNDLNIKSFMKDNQEYIKIIIFRGYTPLSFLTESKANYRLDGELWKEIIYKRSEVFDKIKNWN